VLYEMLTGQPPYDADTPYAIILKHINDPLTPPHVLIGPLPEAIERIVLKCLAKEPSERFTSMAELRADGCRSAKDRHPCSGSADRSTNQAGRVERTDPGSRAGRPRPIGRAASPCG
jgi:serine/threonine protein kinase